MDISKCEKESPWSEDRADGRKNLILQFIVEGSPGQSADDPVAVCDPDIFQVFVSPGGSVLDNGHPGTTLTGGSGEIGVRFKGDESPIWGQPLEDSFGEYAGSWTELQDDLAPLQICRVGNQFGKVG